MDARRSLALFAAAILTLVCACSRQADYPVALMVTDDGLIGVWRSGEDGDMQRIAITARKVNVQNGRTEGADNLPGNGGAGQQVTAYSALLTREGEDGALELSAMLVEVEGVRLLGIQASDEELNRNPLGSIVLPLHFLLKIERDGDTIRAWAPAKPIAWVPNAQWIDPPCEEPGRNAREPDDRIRLTSSIDRLIEVYRAEMKRDDFWSDPPVTFSRAP